MTASRTMCIEEVTMMVGRVGGDSEEGYITRRFPLIAPIAPIARALGLTMGVSSPPVPLKKPNEFPLHRYHSPPLSMHDLCMQHQVTWCASLAAINKPHLPWACPPRRCR
jgi:hypothetical protein